MNHLKIMLAGSIFLLVITSCRKQIDENFTQSHFPDPTASALTVPGSSSQRVLIDLGPTTVSTDQWGKYWNNMTDARPGIRISNAKTTVNTSTTIGVEVINRIDGSFSTSGPGVKTGNSTGIVNEYPANATTDYAFAHKSATDGKWKIFGLDSLKSYTIRFWGTKSASVNYIIQIKPSDETIWQEYNASKNTDYNKAAVFSFTGKKEKSFDIRTKAGSDFGYISVIDITETGAATSISAPLSLTANAGADQSITLPSNSVILQASGTGSIVSYNWAKIAGPAQFSISNAAIVNPIISNLTAGTYTFRLTVKDNSGLTATDDVNIVVNAQLSGSYTVHTLKFNSSNDAYYPNGTGLNWKPGDTVNIPAGNYGVIVLGNIRGDATRPIIIRNTGGLVTVKQIRLDNKMEYFKILGNGTPGLTRGIKIDGKGAGITFAAAMVSDMEVGYIEIANAGVGMMVKKNPVSGVSSSYYPNYTIKNIYIHHNYIHDTQTEGMYIGSTDPTGAYSGGLVPIRLNNVEIAYNTMERNGWDGIQMSTATGINKIHDNVVKDFGTANSSGQQTGIAIGGAASGEIYNNTISNGTGWGINAMGYGTIKIYNNTVENVGANGSSAGAESIYADDRVTGPESFAKQQMIITGNIVKNPKPKGGIRVGAYHNNSLPATIQNNTLYIPNAASNWLTFYVVSNAAGSIISNNTAVR